MQNKRSTCASLTSYVTGNSSAGKEKLPIIFCFDVLCCPFKTNLKGCNTVKSLSDMTRPIAMQVFLEFNKIYELQCKVKYQSSTFLAMDVINQTAGISKKC